VIVDEAARCTPGELAVPIQVGRRVLLVGDHFQLKPMFGHEVLRRMQADTPEMPRAELERSDFERAYMSGFGRKNGQILTEQYRMDPAICELVSKVFYEPHSVKLTTSERRQSDPAFAQGVPSALSHAVTWIDTSSHARSVESEAEWNRFSYWNEAEVDAVLLLLERIADQTDFVRALAKGKSETPIGVICMYSAQKAKLEQGFVQRPWEGDFRRLVRIDTVDSYQGKENAIVVVSLVRNNPEHDVGHVGAPNRCNVAFSRAKERLVVVGARPMWETLSKNNCVRRVLDHLAGQPGTIRGMSEL